MPSNNNSLNEGLIAFGKLALTGLALYAVLDELTGEPADTVLYYLYHKNRIVYIGITYEDRIEQRILEHECKGIIVFDEYDFGYTMSRVKAVKRERSLIQRHRPKYNVHHNVDYAL